MKRTNTLLRKPLMLAAALLLTLAAWLPAGAQVRIPFTQRTAAETPTQKIYTIKGDFQMIGNTNLTSNNESYDNGFHVMSYVDVDGISSTLNSSSATLTLPSADGGTYLPACSSIIYAGLYWLGRAHNGTSPNVFMRGGTTANYQTGTNVNGYALAITQTSTGTGGNTVRTATYIFTPATGSPVIFKLTTNDSEQITALTVQTGTTGTATNLSSTRTDYNSGAGEDYVEATLTNPYIINTGTASILINNLRASTDNNNIDNTFRANVSSGGKIFDKSVVYLKHANASGYTTVSATDINFTKNIYYPPTTIASDGKTYTDGFMYSAYAEVTDYVRQHGIGEYTVADIALTEETGTQDGTGKFGGWGMIVVYENSQMKWRDVTIFDGHAFVAAEETGVDTSNQLTVSGFKTAKNGPIDIKLGLIAGEGDRGITGDHFDIISRANNWVPLSHSGNTTNNFFNSSIPGTNARNPNYTNNTGVDIAMFNITNTNNYIIGNDQTSTTFRYGSSQDTYIIPVIAMAVDAFIPNLVPYIQVGAVNGQPYSPTNAKVLPNGDVQYTLELRNPGNERILNAALNIPVPYTASFVSASAEYFLNTGAPTPQQPTYVVNGNSKSIQWNIGTIPMGNNDLLAKLTFTLKATGDCFLLVNDKCSPKVLVEGSVQGVGEISGTSFSNLRFVHGYKDGICKDEPIIGPLSIDIDATDYVTANCNITNPGYYIKVFDFCKKPGTTTLPFTEIENSFPAGSTFWSAIKTVDQDGVALVVPADGAIQYTSANSFPSTDGESTYYALPPTVSTCYWEFKILVQTCNLWLGNISEDWGTSGNWTQNTIPDGASQDVEYATVDNYTQEAVNDLKLDVNRTIGNITNKSTKRLIIPVNTTLVVDKVADTGIASKLVIQSEVGQANGALILNSPNDNTSIQGTVEFASKSGPASGTWPYSWQYFGVPVKDKTLTGVFGPNVQGSIYGTAGNIIVRKYNEALNLSYSYQEKWEDLNPSTHVLKPFEGYEITQPVVNTKHSFAGTLVTGNSTLNLPVSISTSIYARGSFVLANPYAAPIFYDNLTDDDFVNLEKVVYIFNTGSRQNWLYLNGESQLGNLPGTYTSIPLYPATTIGKAQIPSMQGFLVGADATGLSSGTSTFKFRYETVYRPVAITSANEPMLAPRAGAGKNPTGKPARELKPLITMDVIGQNSSDRLFLVTASDATKAYDDGWDGYKFISPNVAQLYALDADGNPLQVHSDNDLNETYIGFRSGGESSYKLRFRFSNMEGVYNDVFLEDLATGTSYKLKDGTTLSFAPSAGTAEKRFKITGKIAKGNSGDKNSKFLKIRTVSDHLLLDNSTTDSGVLTVYDLVGTSVFRTTFGPGSNVYQLTFKKGSYIIEARTASERTVIKSILK